ncbi:MAG TPA: chemotaxis protein CheW [Stellaceae bacterium]|jgi:purine-binding chemotaxis protein CheW
MLCRVGNQLCALPLIHVVETMRPLPVRPMPGMPPFIAGLSLIRGNPLPVVDGAALIGQPGVAPAARFITLQVGARQVVLAVQDVVDIRALAADPFQAMPPLLGGAQTDVVSAIGALDAEFLWLLDAARMVPAELGAAGELHEATA